jgi:hypothetical protein
MKSASGIHRARVGAAGWIALVAALVGSGCDEPASAPARDAGPSSLAACDGGEAGACPEGWVRAAPGGCGPAALLCQPDGGAAPGACDDPRVRESTPFATDDGGTGWRFGVGPDGSITGGWNARPPMCPEGWRPQDDGACEPVMATCPEGSSPIPGGRCTPTAASDCPMGPFPAPDAETVGARVVYVRADALAQGANGREDHPFRTLREGLADAGADGWVFVAAGTYREALVIPASARVRGLCAARVTLDPGAVVAMEVTGSLRLRGVSVRGGVRVRGSLDAREVALHATGGSAVEIDGEGARATLRDVRFILPMAGANFAVRVVRGASVAVTNFAVEAGAGVGFYAASAVPLTLADGTVRGVRPDGASEWAGRALWAQGGARVTADRLVLDDNTEQAITLHDRGTELTLRHAVIRGTRPVGPDGGGKGIETKFGASATLEYVRLIDNANASASAFEGASLTLRDCLVRDTHARGNGTGGRGVDAHHMGTLTVERTVVEGSHEVGVFSFDQSSVTLRDVVVRRTDAPKGVSYGAGVGVVLSALDARRVLVEDSTEVGVAVIDPSSRATIEDLIVRGVRASRRRFAMGFVTSGGARVTASRVAVVDVVGVGVGTQEYGSITRSPNTRVEGRDYYVHRVSDGLVQYNMSDPGHPSSVTASYGLVVGTRTAIALARVTLDTVDTGLALLGPFTGRDVVVTRSRRFGVLNRTEFSAALFTVPDSRCAQVLEPVVVIDDTLVDPRLPVASFRE